ncbi:MAG: hypothetical protein ACOY5R_07545 [Pseudomonadota bacterium]
MASFSIGLSIAVAVAGAALAGPVQAAGARDLLVEAAFRTRDRGVALERIAEAESLAGKQLLAKPGDEDARLTRAMAVGYRAKLTRSRSDALSARKSFEAIAAANPRDAEAVASVGTWHLDSVVDLGAMMAGIAIGAKKATGFGLMDRAVALGGGRALYPGLAALLRLAIDPGDARGRQLAEAASVATVSAPLDRIFRNAAIAILVPLKAGDGRATQKLARELLPFGRLAG